MMTAHTDQSWLALVLSESSSDSFESMRRFALSEAVTEAERRTVHEEALRAEQLRAVMVDHRRRAAELTALNDLALRLAGEHDLDALLQDTVIQARRLLGVDVAYLALTEPDGTLTIKVTDGSIGHRLRGVQLQRGRSLAGRVVERSEPFQSIDYVTDFDFAHSESVDQVAIAEGLRTIVGAPLRLRGRVIGVLMVAHREVRRLSDSELSTLCSLGAFAGVAIDNARQMESHRHTAEQLSSVNADLELHVASVNRAAVLHDDLLEVALRGGGTEQVVVSLSEVVSGLVQFVDEADVAQICARTGVPQASVPVSLIDGMKPSECFGDPARRRTWASPSVVTVPVASAHTYYGCIEVHDDVAAVTSWDLRLLERSAMTIALVAAAERAVLDAERRTTNDMLEQLVAGRIDDEAVFQRRGLPLGLDLTVPHSIVLMDHVQDGGAAADPLRMLVAAHGGATGRVAGRAVAAVRADLDEVRAFLGGLDRRMSRPVGLGGPATGALAFSAAYQDAMACLTALNSLGRSDSFAAPADLGPYRFLLSQAGHHDADRFVRQTIGPLITQDNARHTELVRTADVFLTTGRQHSAAAAELHIHANTLYQRLERITAVLGDGWRESDRALDVQMALRMWRLLDR